RDAERAGQPGQREPDLPIRIHAAICEESPIERGLPDIQQQDGLQPAEELSDFVGAIAEPDDGAAESSAELQSGSDGIYLLDELPVEVVPSRGLYVLVEQVQYHGLQYGFTDLLPNDQLPFWNSGRESAGGYCVKHALAKLHLQHDQQPDASTFGQGVDCGFAGSWTLGRCTLLPATHSLRAILAHALPADSPGWPQRSRSACAAWLHSGHQRCSGSSELAFLRRRRRGTARL